MILGILDRDRDGSEFKRVLLQTAAHVREGNGGMQATVWASRHFAFCSTPVGIATLDEAPQPFLNEDGSVVVMFEGKIHNIAEIKRLLGSDYGFRTDCSGEALAQLYEKYHEGCVEQVNGKFAFALWDESSQKLLLGRDRLGIQPLYYVRHGESLIFGSSLRAIVATGWVRKDLNYEAVLQYLVYCYNPARETLLQDVYKLPPGHLLSCNGSAMSIKKYWQLSFAETQVKSEEEYREEILSLIEDAIRIRIEPRHSPGLFLSGGTDSSALASLTSRMSPQPLHTFSFRCEGRSYDESYYARSVSQRYGTQHVEVPYHANHLPLISRAVQSMDEPFCDIGIEIGTYLLGQAAEGRVSYALSGEGGDELFGGHPVYIAAKLATVADRFPRALRYTLARTLQRIPDTDQKKDLRVKLKRFAYGLFFPPELLSHRWRICYTAQELRELCTDEFIQRCDLEGIFDGVLNYNRNANGRDQLSRSLYSDYQTVVSFYLLRLGLLRAFSIESRLPLLDHRLVEYAAKIPSWLKIRRVSDTKYIYKKVLQSVLPKEILYNRPKLGHSVPMKNWLRNNAEIRGWITGVLCDGSFKDMGLFRPHVVQRLIDEHMRKSQNHSHRLWGLVVLKLWVRNCLEEGSR